MPRFPVVSLIILLGAAGATSYAITEHQSFQSWPKEVRDDLCIAMRAKHRGALMSSQKHFRKAWETAQSMPLTSFGRDPYLKLSAIAVALGVSCEAIGHPEDAVPVLITILAKFESHESDQPAKFTQTERMRAIALATKTGNLIHSTIGIQNDLAEKMLRRAAVYARKYVKLNELDAHDATEDTVAMFSELELPRWVTKVDATTPLEALGAFYSRIGNIKEAILMYTEAAMVLFKSVDADVSNPLRPLDNICRCAHLGNKVAEMGIKLLQTRGNPPVPSGLSTWAEEYPHILARATLSLLEQAVDWNGSVPFHGNDICRQTLPAVLLNLATLAEMQGEQKTARVMYAETLKQAKLMGTKDVEGQAQSALQRLGEEDDDGVLHSETEESSIEINDI